MAGKERQVNFRPKQDKHPILARTANSCTACALFAANELQRPMGPST